MFTIKQSISIDISATEVLDTIKTVLAQQDVVLEEESLNITYHKDGGITLQGVRSNSDQPTPVVAKPEPVKKAAPKKVAKAKPVAKVSPKPKPKPAVASKAVIKPTPQVKVSNPVKAVKTASNNPFQPVSTKEDSTYSPSQKESKASVNFNNPFQAI